MGLATLRTDYAPIFEKPSGASRRLDELLYGMSAQIIQQSDSGWCYLRTEYGIEGYSPTSGFESDPKVAAAWRKYKKMTVLAPYIDVQAEPSLEAQRLLSVPRGGILVPLGVAGEDGWQKVGLANGAVGYTCASYLAEVVTDWQMLDEGDVRWNVVETALSYNGTAWRSGGRTPLGIDAVGLVAMSYQMNGILLPRTLTLQNEGLLRPVRKKDMDEGDVIFFTGSVGIYMGEDRFVHATDIVGGEGVVVSSLRPKDEDYRGDLAENIEVVASVFGEG